MGERPLFYPSRSDGLQDVSVFVIKLQAAYEVTVRVDADSEEQALQKVIAKEWLGDPDMDFLQFNPKELWTLEEEM